jgi:putative hydrolase of the HAD superfamily
VTVLPFARSLRAVLFDAGETLIFLRPSAVGAYALICREAGLDLDEESLGRGLAFAGRAFAERMRAREDLRIDDEGEFAHWVEVNRLAFESMGVEGVDIVGLSRRIQDAFTAGRISAVGPDTLATLRRLRASGLRLGVVSNASRGMGEVLAREGIIDLVDAVAISTVVGWEKPSPQIFQHCLAALGVEPGEAIHVGDSVEADGAGARAAGLAGFVLMTHGRPSPPEHLGPTIPTLGALLPLLGLDATAR